MVFQFFFRKYQEGTLFRAHKKIPNLHFIPSKVKVIGWPFETTDNILETDGEIVVTLRDLREEKNSMSVFMNEHIEMMESEHWLIDPVKRPGS